MSSKTDENEVAGAQPAVEAVRQVSSDWHSLSDRIAWPRIGQQLGLSTRELQIVQQIFDGKTLQYIAEELHLGLGTIKTYCQRIHHKLGVTDQRELALAVLNAHLGTSR